MFRGGRVWCIAAFALGGCERAGSTVAPEGVAPPVATPAASPMAAPSDTKTAEMSGAGVATVGIAQGDDCGDIPAEQRPAHACVDRQRGDILHPKIEFDYDKAVIRPASYAALDEVVALLAAHPEITLVEVAGHHATREETHY